MYELSRDISGIDNVYVPEREFLRQGCLSKFSQRKGYQQRMFFLVGLPFLVNEEIYEIIWVLINVRFSFQTYCSTRLDPVIRSEYMVSYR